MLRAAKWERMHPATSQTGAARRRAPLHASTPEGLAAVGRRLRGWRCDLHGVALDDQAGKLHLPLRGRAGRGGAPAGELVVRGVVELSVAAAAKVRWFDISTIAHDREQARLTIRSEGALGLLVGVERLDVVLRLAPGL